MGKDVRRVQAVIAWLLGSRRPLTQTSESVAAVCAIAMMKEGPEREALQAIFRELGWSTAWARW